ncbi:hypothetical protein ACWZEH_33130 [Streptomyces sp. QTS137]
MTADTAFSLDGHVAGNGVAPGSPGGDGAEEDGGSEAVREWFDATGAMVTGRTMCGPGEEFRGDDPPFRTPVLVLTHRPRPNPVREGGTAFTLVTDGIHSALDRAKAVAGSGSIAGGASTVRQHLGEGLIGEL